MYDYAIDTRTCTPYIYIYTHTYLSCNTLCKYFASRVLVHTVDLNCNFSVLFVWFDPNRSTSFGRITVFEDVLRWSRVSGLWSSTKDASRSFFWFKPEIERWHRDTCPIERVDESLMLEDKIRKDPECKKLEKAYQKLGQQWFAQHTEIYLHRFQLSSHGFFNHNPHISFFFFGSQFVKEIPGLHWQGMRVCWFWSQTWCFDSQIQLDSFCCARFMTAHWWLLGKLLVDLVLCWSRLQNSWWEKDHTNLQICNWQIPNFWRHLCRKTAIKNHSVCWTWLWPQQFHHTTGIYKLQGVCLAQSCVIIQDNSWILQLCSCHLFLFLGKKKQKPREEDEWCHESRPKDLPPFPFQRTALGYWFLKSTRVFLLAESFSVDAWDQAGKQKWEKLPVMPGISIRERSLRAGLGYMKFRVND